MSHPRSESGGPAVAASNRRRRALTYDDLPNGIKGVIKDYVAFTNASLRQAVFDYFEDKAATERRHGNINTWDVGRVTDMSHLFSYIMPHGQEGNNAWDGIQRENRQDFDDNISAWDTSSVTTMNSMFRGCRSFVSDIGAWDTSSVTDMSSMFGKCEAFDSDIGAWDVSQVRNMKKTFMYCRNFNANIGSWNTLSAVLKARPSARVERIHCQNSARGVRRALCWKRCPSTRV